MPLQKVNILPGLLQNVLVELPCCMTTSTCPQLQVPVHCSQPYRTPFCVESFAVCYVDQSMYVTQEDIVSPIVCFVY